MKKQFFEDFFFLNIILDRCLSQYLSCKCYDVKNYYFSSTFKRLKRIQRLYFFCILNWIFQRSILWISRIPYVTLGVVFVETSRRSDDQSFVRMMSITKNRIASTFRQLLGTISDILATLGFFCEIVMMICKQFYCTSIDHTIIENRYLVFYIQKNDNLL